MPEGDTVWLAAKRMHDAFAGRTLTGSDFRVPQLATADLSGRQVREVVPRGKHMLTRLSGDLTLHTHFLMEGSWHLYRPGARWRQPAFQARVILTNDEWQAVGFRLPVIELLRTAAEGRAVDHLGPDVLGPDWDLDEALRRLRERPDREIGPALLDQRNLAGIGNIYKTESLFLEKLTPWTPVADVPDLPALVLRARTLIDRNKEDWPQTTTGSTQRGAEHWVYGRARRPCLRCGTRVRTANQGGAIDEDRVSFWCPRCQRGPAPDRDTVPERRGRPGRTGGPGQGQQGQRAQWAQRGQPPRRPRQDRSDGA